MSTRRASIAAIGIFATTFALTGCGSAFVAVDFPLGIGTCDSEAISLNVSQNGPGDEVVIDYSGPSDVSLIAYQGIYSDTKFWDQSETESFIISYPIFDDVSPYDYAINALDFESAPWTVTSTGASTINAVFDGRVDALVDSFDYNFAESGPDMAMWDKIFPVTIAVNCTDNILSNLIEDPPIDDNGVIGGFDVAVAQPIFPNFMYVDAPTVTQQRPITNGVRGKMRLPAEIIDALPNDIGDIAVDVSMGYLGEEDPYDPATIEQGYTLDGATLGEVWLLTMEAVGSSDESSPTFEIVGDPALTDEMTFKFTGEQAPDDGYYIVTFVVGDTGNDPDYVKISTAVLRYSSTQGLALSGLDEPPVFDKLATTGSDPNAIIWAVLGGLVVIAAVFLRPNRRKAQAESAKAPSDLK